MRQRLIGAAVLVLIAVILIPWLVSRSHHPREQVHTLAVPDAGSTDAPVVLTLPPLPGSKTAVAGNDKRRPDKTADGRTMVDAAAPATAHATAGQDRMKTQKSRRTSVKGTSAAGDAVARVGSGKKADKTRQEPAPKARPERTPAAAATNNKSSIAKGDWYLQVASFSSWKNAQAMLDKLHQAGFNASISVHEAHGKRWHRVRVGPYPDKKAAQAAAKRLHALNGTQPLLHRADGSGG